MNIFENLLEGNNRFRHSNIDFRKLKDSQCPEFVVVSCSDSRVSPPIITSSSLGRIFEVRTAGASVDEYALASVEFAVSTLGVKGVMVMGHTGCGAVTEAQKMLMMKSSIASDNSALGKLVSVIHGVISENQNNGMDLTGAIKEFTLSQMETLLRSEIIRNKVESGSVEISAAIYDLETGSINLL